MKEAYLYFPKQCEYEDKVFEGDTIHLIKEEVPGFINRWIRRGCVEVDKADVEQAIKEEEKDCGCKDEEKEKEILAERKKEKAKKSKTKKKTVEKAEE